MRVTDEARALLDEEVPRRASARRFLVAALGLAVVGAITAAAVIARDLPDPPAQLRVRTGAVSVVHQGSPFTTATDGQDLLAGDVVRTDGGGLAQLDLFDGSQVRMDNDTQVVLRELADASEGRTVSLALDGGRTWNRVTTARSNRDTFEVRMKGGIARVRGTTFFADCRRSPTGPCYLVGVEGSTRVISADEGDSTLGDGDCLALGPQGGVTPCDQESLGLIDTWVKENLAEDQQLELSGPPTPSPTPTPAATTRPSSPVAPAATTAAPTPTLTPKPTPEEEPEEEAEPTPSPRRRRRNPTPSPTATPSAEPTPTDTPTPEPEEADPLQADGAHT